MSSDRRIAQGDRFDLEPLLQYIERPPASLERLEYRDDGRVLYRGKDNPSLHRDYQLCSPVEFLAMLVPHVALRHECRIHTFGAISTSIRRQLGWLQKDEGPEAPEGVMVAEEQESGFVRLRRRNWARLISKVCLEVPELCESCGERTKVLAALTSPHQDDAIERILKARGEWDPPWRRERRARGPPRHPRQLEIVFGDPQACRPRLPLPSFPGLEGGPAAGRGGRAAGVWKTTP